MSHPNVSSTKASILSVLFIPVSLGLHHIYAFSSQHSLGVSPCMRCGECCESMCWRAREMLEENNTILPSYGLQSKFNQCLNDFGLSK